MRKKKESKAASGKVNVAEEGQRDCTLECGQGSLLDALRIGCNVHKHTQQMSCSKMGNLLI